MIIDSISSYGFVYIVVYLRAYTTLYIRKNTISHVLRGFVDSEDLRLLVLYVFGANVRYLYVKICFRLTKLHQPRRVRLREFGRCTTWDDVIYILYSVKINFVFRLTKSNQPPLAWLRGFGGSTTWDDSIYKNLLYV